MPFKIFMVGFFKEALELAEESGHEVIGCIDRMDTGKTCGCPLFGDDESLPDFIHKLEGALAFLTPDQPSVRHRLQEHYAAYQFAFASLISPQSRISDTATVGEGAFIQWNAHLSSGTKIGRFVRVNVSANLMHDVHVGDFSTIAPNACVLGGVSIGSQCYIGANSTLLPGITIGDGATVGAGAVVTRNVASRTVVAGIPARPLISR
jgi:sugar O-acyltransferase (sialic acid O-acetyltransferase NeuD family)